MTDIDALRALRKKMADQHNAANTYEGGYAISASVLAEHVKELDAIIARVADRPREVTHRQIWVGSTDITYLLLRIGGWHVNCSNHEEASRAVLSVEEQGWVGRRTHYAPAFPEGVEAFELTDAGIEKVREWFGDREAAKTTKNRQWYRDAKDKWLREHPPARRELCAEACHEPGIGCQCEP